MLCRRPPETFLSSPSCLSSLRLSDVSLGVGCSDDGTSDLCELRVSASDLVDSSYQFSWPRLANLFAFEYDYAASELGIDHFVDVDCNVIPLGPAGRILPCLRTLPMEFSWSMFFCNSVLVENMVEAAERHGMTHEEALPLVVTDDGPMPILSLKRPLLLLHVDDGNSLHWSESDAIAYGVHLSQVLYEHGLAFRVECAGTATHEMLGITLRASE